MKPLVTYIKSSGLETGSTLSCGGSSSAMGAGASAYRKEDYGDKYLQKAEAKVNMEAIIHGQKS
jgi:hypothetical protein